MMPPSMLLNQVTLGLAFVANTGCVVKEDACGLEIVDAYDLKIKLAYYVGNFQCKHIDAGRVRNQRCDRHSSLSRLVCSGVQRWTCGLVDLQVQKVHRFIFRSRVMGA